MNINEAKKGRPKGSLNKVSVTLKSRINLFLDRNLDDLQQEYDNLESKDKLNFMTSLLPYLMPKLSAVAADVAITNKLETMNESQLNELIDLVLSDGHDDEEAE